ncbi:MAG: nucleotidyltransferase domain-containing protein [Candidatus Rokubacteria bacterium]|nr:nucleotidyltransferase domain-containing protein [Candidatus Rokubacteria bacterium]
MTTAQRLAQRILEADRRRISKIILLGSRARGDARPDSDYDLLVIVPGLRPAEVRPYTTRLYGALADTGVVAEPFVMSEEEFEETKLVVGGLARPAWKEGVVLYENA